MTPLVRFSCDVGLTPAPWVYKFVKEALEAPNNACLDGTWKDGVFTPSPSCSSSVSTDSLCVVWREIQNKKMKSRDASPSPSPDPVPDPAPAPTSPKPAWVVMVGDSNFRRVFLQLCADLKLTSEHGFNQFSDRECRGPNVLPLLLLKADAFPVSIELPVCPCLEWR